MKRSMLYLGEIVDRDGIELGSNNMIISPVGSGKTHFIFERLHEEGVKSLMLVSTRSLKDSLEMEGGTFTTASMNSRLKDNGISGKDIYLMTYSEFGSLIAFDNGFAEEFSVIYCDEIHSLFDYFSYTKDYKLATAIKYLFDKHDDKTIYYFTATVDKIKSFMDNIYGDILRNVKVFNYYKSKDIVRYTNMIKIDFTDIYGMMGVLDYLEDFGLNGEKGVIFNSRIDGMKKIEDLVEAKGYKVISIWSTSNSKNPMSDEQLRVRRHLLRHGVIPEEYDFIIINGAMREGWNLLDENVELVMLNTEDETDLIQARGRIRKNVAIIAQRVGGEKTPIEVRIMRREESVRAIEGVLGIELDSSAKDEIVDKLSVVRDNGRLVKWPGIRKALESYGYEVKDKRVRIDGKQRRVSIISKSE